MIKYVCISCLSLFYSCSSLEVLAAAGEMTSMESDGAWPVPGTASDRGRKMAGKRSNNMQRYQEIQEIQYRN